LQQALPVAENNHDHVGLAETEWNLAQLSAYMYQLETSEAHGQRALALARQLALPELTARSLTVVGFVEIGLARWADSEGHYEEACLLSKELGNRALETESLCGIARARVNAGCPQAAVGPARAAHTINLESDNQWGQGVSAFHLALALSECGEYGEALETAQAGVNVARIYYEFAPLPILNLTVLGIIHRAMLNVEAAQAAHQEAIAVSESRPYQPLLRMTAAELCADSALLGDWAAAHHYARQSLTAVNHSLLHGGLWHWYITEALLRGGDIELARADLVRFGEQFASNRRYQIPYRRCQAVLAQWEDDIEQAISHLEEAHTLAKELNLPGEQRQILAALRKLYQANRLTS
jgi:tetratricopeptide (TPR) repeat protein